MLLKRRRGGHNAQVSCTGYFKSLLLFKDCFCNPTRKIARGFKTVAFQFTATWAKRERRETMSENNVIGETFSFVWYYTAAVNKIKYRK